MGTPKIRDFTDLVSLFANHLKLQHNGKQFNIISPVGEGYCWAEKLPGDITVLVSDTNINHPCNVGFPETDGHYYVLHFNEEIAGEVTGSGKMPVKRQTDYHSWVKLSESAHPEDLFFSSGVRTKSVRIFFNKAILSAYFNEILLTEVVTKFFPKQMDEKNLAPIATEYRIMLDELLHNEIQQPLRLNYIRNRVILLLEKYILKLSLNGGAGTGKAKRNEDEVVRLMKVEALLVKNFSEQSPTISELSRISAMSPTKLKNDFKRQYGMPVYEYYQKNRMLKAKNLLLTGKYSIKEVGNLVGYSNLSHFASTFKKEFGHLPSELTNKDGVLLYNE